MLTNIYDFYRHNFGFVTGLLLSPLVILYGYGCQSQTVSLVDSSKRVTRAELLSEVEGILAMAEARISDLDRQDLVRNTMFNSVSELIQSNPASPVGVALFLANLLGIGAVLDNVKKRTLISTLKSRVENAEKKSDSVPETT